MKFDFNKRYTTIAIYAFLVLAAAILFSGLMGNLGYFQIQIARMGGILTPFIYGFGIAYLLNPILKAIERLWVRPVFARRASEKFCRSLAILITYLLAAGVIGVFIKIVAPQLSQSIASLVNRLSSYINSADVWLPKLLAYFPEVDLFNTFSKWLEQYANTLINTTYRTLTQLLPRLVQMSTMLASGLLSVVVGIIISIYMLIDKERFCASIKRFWYAFLPNKQADWLLELAGDANRVFGGFINGKLLDSLIIGILCFFCLNIIDMTFLRMPNIMLVSVIVGVTNVIPYFGPFIGAIPSFFIILIDAPVSAVVFLIFVLILQQFDGNILGPKILGDSTGLSAFWVVFAIMLFGGLYGFIGMFLGVPVFSVIYMLFHRLILSRLKSRNMPLN